MWKSLGIQELFHHSGPFFVFLVFRLEAGDSFVRDVGPGPVGLTAEFSCRDQEIDIERWVCDGPFFRGGMSVFGVPCPMCWKDRRAVGRQGYAWRRALVIYALLVMVSVWLDAVGGVDPPNGPSPGTFDQYFEVTWGGDHVHMADGGSQVQLTLDQVNTSSFASKGKYLFGYLSTGIKLVPSDSAGTVTAYYMASDTSNTRDELDFEFLGNSSGQPYILQTNVFASGIGRREQRIYLWFDPSADFHTYAVLWNEQQIVFYVDDYPIRIFENKESEGIAFPKAQPMGIFASLWNGDSWATQGGAVKLNWTYAPFVATFGDFEIQACEATSASNCAAADGWWAAAEYQTLSQADMSKLKWVQQNYMVYDYCTDTLRYAQPPPDCARLTGK